MIAAACCVLPFEVDIEINLAAPDLQNGRPHDEVSSNKRDTLQKIIAAQTDTDDSLSGTMRGWFTCIMI